MANPFPHHLQQIQYLKSCGRRILTGVSKKMFPDNFFTHLKSALITKLVSLGAGHRDINFDVHCFHVIEHVLFFRSLGATC